MCILKHTQHKHTNTMRQITQCFNTPLASIYKQASQLETLTTLVQRHLGNNTNEPVRCKVSRFANGCLTLAVEDPVWATQLRYELPTLRDKLRQEGLHQLTSIRINLLPATPAAKPPKKKSRDVCISTEAKRNIRESATHCSYAPLKEALERLSKHQASTSNNSGKE